MKEIEYHCIGNAATGDSLDELRSMAWEDGVIACTRHTWVWAIYHWMKRLGARATFGYEPVEGAINIVHGQVARGLLTSVDFKRSYIVGIRADYRPFGYGHFEVVQNTRTARGRKVFMPLFPQPGLIPRDARRDGVRNVCVSGRVENSICANELEEGMKAMGLEFVFRGVGQWQNMREVDVLLGIRSLTRKKYNDKPATKLFNAWLAGIPFIGGYDSAFSQVGRPGENYLRVSSSSELITAVSALRDDSDLYARIVNNGKKAVEAYTAENTARRWLDFLETRVVPAYMKWDAGDPLERARGAVGGAVFNLYEHHLKPAAREIVSGNKGGA